MTTNEIFVIWTLVLATAIVLVLAGYLIAIAWYLYRAGGSRKSLLAQLAGGLVGVAANVKPLDEKIATIAGALGALRDELLTVEQNLGRTADAVRR